MASEIPISRSIALESTPTAIVEVCRWILSKLQEKGFSQEDTFAVHLALQEAFTNAVRHGNKMSPNKEVKIDYSVGLDKFEVSLTDEGEGFDPDAVPDPRYGDNLFKPEGRGLLLMRSYMDVVEFNEHGNGVYMARYRGKPQLTRSQGETQA
ncbi:MAG: ATP-binding protein [Planctomycetota bacterium]|jgi:serine/threonine-protein kinase RsbW